MTERALTVHIMDGAHRPLPGPRLAWCLPCLGAMALVGCGGSADPSAPPRYVDIREVPPPSQGRDEPTPDDARSGVDVDGGAPQGTSHLGVIIRSASSGYGSSGPRGLLVLRVLPDAPAAHAGLRPGDIIQSVDGTAMEHSQTLVRYIKSVPPGVAVRLEVVRDGNRQTFDVVTAPRPDDSDD